MGYSVSFWHENLLLCILYHFDIVRNLGMCRCGRIILVSILPKESNLEVVGGLTPYSSSISTPLSFLLVFPFLLPCLQWSSWTVRGAPAPLNLPLIIDCCVHVLVVLLTTRSLHSYIHFRLIQAIGTALAEKLMHEVANVGWGIAPSSHILTQKMCFATHSFCTTMKWRKTQILLHLLAYCKHKSYFCII